MLELVRANGVCVEKAPPVKPPKRAAGKKPSGLVAKSFIEESLKALERGPVDAEGVTAYSDAANDEPDAPVVFSGQSELQMRRIIEDLGLERMPFTVAEYEGVLEYFDWFEQATGKHLTAYTTAPHLIVSLHVHELNFARERRPHWAPALELYLQEKGAELKDYHAKHRFVEYLGAWWVWSEKRDDDIRAKRAVDEAACPAPFSG